MQDDSTPPVATAKATPGPWRAHQHAKGFWRIRGASGPYFAEVDTEPDARLIAAAPDLLEALEGIALGGCCQTPGCSPDDPKCDVMAARAAIAQAKGEVS